MSAVKSNPGRAKIIYALCSANDENPCGKIKGGLEGAAVYALDHEGLRAIVSDTLSPKVRPERRNITAHQAVLHTLTEKTTVLPMRFGVIARNADTVKKLLETNRKAILKHIDKLHGRVEMGLRVSWDTANIYEYFIGKYPVLREARDEVYSKSTNVSRDAKVELGRLYEQLREAERKSCADKVKDVLIGYCEEIVENPVKKENEVMNLACLVDREQLDNFAEGVFKASKPFDNVYLFNYTGPWAPHNFVALDLLAPKDKGKDKDQDKDEPESEAD